MEPAWRGVIWLTVALMMAMEIRTCLAVEKGEKVPALFVFGDSLLDTGNNNGLNTIARASSPPYGTDFQNGSPGGRFSNGPITTDFIAASLNLACPPAYVDAGNNIEHGVNFASAGSGILDSTGSFFGEHYSMGAQVKKFADVKTRLTKKVGRKESDRIISKSIFYIIVGSNDYLVTYYAVPPTSIYSFYTPQRFKNLLISNLTAHLKELYYLGARKFAVTAIPNIGCTPYAVRMYGERARDEFNCIKFMNEAAKAYNRDFFQLIQSLQTDHPDAHFISNNGYATSIHTYTDHTAYGIVNVKDACCNYGELLQGVCMEGFIVCSNASQYYFFDGFHPTSHVHNVTAQFYINGTSPYVSPYNLLTLASLP